MKKMIIMLGAMLIAGSAMAFPSWMGAYGIYKKHDDRANPGQFSIMMNQDYVGLQAEVGIQVDGGNWVMYPMNYAGNINGNSYWTFTPSFVFPGGSTVKYFFHGFDNGSGNIWDSRNGLNYEFTVSPDPDVIVERLADGTWNGPISGDGISAWTPVNSWIDFKIKDIGTPMMIGIVWTWNEWADHETTSAVFEGDLDDGFQQWGVDLLPAGVMQEHRSLGFIRWFIGDSDEYIPVENERQELKYAIFYVVGGTWHWDNNGGDDYSIIIGEEDEDGHNPDDTDNDGLLDAWEMEYFGNLDQGPTDNPDGDGVPGIPFANIIEQQAGTDPNVGNDPNGVGLMWSSAYPVKGESVTLSYSMGNEGNPLFGKPVYAHIGHNGWESTYQTDRLTWNGATGRYEIQVTVPADAAELNVVFTDKDGAWDNNNGNDWTISIRP